MLLGGEFFYPAVHCSHHRIELLLAANKRWRGVCSVLLHTMSRASPPMLQYGAPDDVIPRKRNPLVLAGEYARLAAASRFVPARCSSVLVFITPREFRPLSLHNAGALVTAGVLVAGLVAFKQVRPCITAHGWRAGCSWVGARACPPTQFQVTMTTDTGAVLAHLLAQGNQNLSQHMMRARVAAQVTGVLAAAYTVKRPCLRTTHTCEQFSSVPIPGWVSRAHMHTLAHLGTHRSLGQWRLCWAPAAITPPQATASSEPSVRQLANASFSAACAGQHQQQQRLEVAEVVVRRRPPGCNPHTASLLYHRYVVWLPLPFKLAILHSISLDLRIAEAHSRAKPWGD